MTLPAFTQRPVVIGFGVGAGSGVGFFVGVGVSVGEAVGTTVEEDGETRIAVPLGTAVDRDADGDWAVHATTTMALTARAQ